MRFDRLQMEGFTKDADASPRDVVLNCFELSGKAKGSVWGLEHVPEAAESGFVAICRKGECVMALDDSVYDFNAGRICIGFASTEVRTLWKSSDFECMALAADVAFLQNTAPDLFTAIRRNPCMSLSGEDMIALSACFEHIRSVYERRDLACHVEITKRLLLVLCCEIAAVYQRHRPAKGSVYSDRDALFRDFVHLLSSKYQEERRVSYYAEELRVTPRCLTDAVKKVSGKTAAEWIDDLMLRNIKILLTTTTLTIQQISEQLNFPNPSFFTKYFRRSTGKTPKSFRTKWAVKTRRSASGNRK
jgi:AraC-like DNA-binding protein